MTHDELPYIAIIEDLNKLIRKQMKAIDAVMALHKPMSDREPYCNECRGVHQGEVDVVLYPCSTIQTIEKELG